jgi:hypothetical protein
MTMTAMTNALYYVQRVTEPTSVFALLQGRQDRTWHAAGDHTYARPYDHRRRDSSGDDDIQYILNGSSKQNKYCIVRSVRDVP